MKTHYITTPIYYVNSVPHVGHAYTTILCDTVSRFYQVRGMETYFLTGTDEHGDKIAKAAVEEGISPQEITDKYSQRFRDLLPLINCEPSDFIRTTEKRHTEVVSNLLQKVFDKGDIYKAAYEGKYCYGCERYLGDDELVEGKCPDHQVEPELISEENYFFKMSKYWEPLKQYIHDHPDFVTESYKNEVLGLLKMEPTDLCISRPKTRLEWGVEFPFDKDYVTYVWFDALINYVSALGYPEGEKFNKFWQNSHHVIAKDILKPHCVYWPTMLMSMEIPLPKQVAVHGYWTVNASKMSKSTGNAVDPVHYCEKYSADVFRYFIVRGMKFGRDANFDHQVFVETCNAELSNNFGNLVSRTFGMARKNFDKGIPPWGPSEPVDDQLKKELANLVSKAEKAMEDWRVADYLETVVEFGKQINKYLDETKPWSLAKEEGQKERLGTILRLTLEGIKIAYAWLWPSIPETAERVFEALNLEKNPLKYQEYANSWDLLQAGAELPKKAPGFPRIED